MKDNFDLKKYLVENRIKEKTESVDNNLNENNIKVWNNLNQDDFEGDLIRWNDSLILIAYDSIFNNDLFKILDYIKFDEKILKSKYPQIKYKINLGTRSGELPFIEID
jgi:hypothetical protein